MIQRRLGRALGSGTLKLVQRGRDSKPQWTLCFTDAQGKRRRIALSSDKRVAEMKRNQLIAERDMQALGLGSVAGQSRPLREVVEIYMTDLATRATAEHCVNVRAHLERALRHLRVPRVCDVQPVAVLAYRANRIQEGCSVRTANISANALRTCLEWAERLDLIGHNPLKKMPQLRESEATRRYRRRAMSDEEIERFLQAAYDDDRRNAMHRRRVPQAPLWRFLLEGGCRYGETRQITWADLDLEAGTVTLRATTTKAHRERTIPILDGLVAELRDLQHHHVAVLKRPLRPSDVVFLTANGCAWSKPTNNLMRIFDRLLEAAGIDRVDTQGRKLDVHAMRHSAASRFARAGVPLLHAQKLLGHSDPKLTAAIYTHLGVEDLRGSVQRIAGNAHTKSDTFIAV